jgi:hypothetical protein
MPRKRSHTIGYLRVSTNHQDTTKNQADILVLAHQHALGEVRFIEEKASGKTPWRRRQIADVLHMLGVGKELCNFSDCLFALSQNGGLATKQTWLRKQQYQSNQYQRCNTES